MRRIIRALIPPQRWRVAVIIASGAITGLFCLLFYISKAHSYLSDDSETCMNCHIMAPQFSTWNHSSHREVAGCVECHVPHNNIFNKYYFKAKDGLRHATIFTLRREPQVIFIHDAGKRVVQNNCIRCHTELITDGRLNIRTSDFQHFRNSRNCNECHRETPHGRVNSLSSVPYARVPIKMSPVPEWITGMIKKKEQ